MMTDSTLPASLPTTMTAAMALPDGRIETVTLPLPVPAAGEVLIRVHASGVNPLDIKIRRNAAGHARQPLPAVLGLDLAGMIAATGPGVENLHPGDPVWAMATGFGGRQGALAEYVTADARLVVHKPATLTMQEAAALPLVTITAWEGLVDRARVQQGQKVLIIGAAGGVGHVAVQIARAFGATVVGLDDRRHAPFLKALGAEAEDRDTPLEEIVNHHTGGEGFDIVYCTIGGQALDTAFQAVRRFGHVVSSLGWGTHSLAPLSFRAASYSGVFTLLPVLTGIGMEHHGHILRQAARLADAGALRPWLDPTVHTLAHVADAYDRLESGNTAGRLVVSVP